MTPINLAIDAHGIAALEVMDPPATLPLCAAAWRDSLRATVDTLIARQDQVRGVIIEFKPSGATGADLCEFLPAGERTTAHIYHEAEAVKADLRRLETWGRPLVACLYSGTLAGAWEIALCAHHRVAVDAANALFGLTQVTIGLVPGTGGAVRSVRMLGLVAAAAQIMDGRSVSLAEARQTGVIGALAEDRGSALATAREWIEAHPESMQPWDRKGYRIPGGDLSVAAVAQAVALAPAVLRRKTGGLYPAPEAALATLVESVQVDFDTALRIESRYFAKLCGEPVTRSLLTLTAARRLVHSGALRPPGDAATPVARVAVIGSGMMGAGIAYANASRGLSVAVCDVSRDAAQRALDHARQLSDARRAKGHLDEGDQLALLKRIGIVDGIGQLGAADLAIEAVFEDADLKKRVLRELEELMPTGTLLASNTSTLPIAELAGALRRPANFLGLHFFSPVERMPLVEIVRGPATSESSLARAYDYVVALGKTPIVVNDARGFFTSRTFASFILEGAALLAEGAPAALIENAAHAVGLPTGPLALLDETSLRLSLQVAREAAKATAVAGFAPQVHPGLRVIARMVEELDRAGRSAGGGFYEYPDGAKKFLWPGLASAFPGAAGHPGVAEIGERYLYCQAIEAARCLHEGVLRNEVEGNLGSILGIGFPAWTGGALYFIHYVGPKVFAARAREFEAALGARFAVPPRIIESVIAAHARDRGAAVQSDAVP